MREIAERAIARAMKAGASYADARAIAYRHQAIHTKNGAAEALSDMTEQGIGVRVIADGAWGFAGTASATPTGAEEAADLAVRIAKASASLSATKAELAPVSPARGEWHSQFDIDPFSVPLEPKLALLLEADKIMREDARRSRGNRGDELRTREEKWFASSEGASIAQTRIQSGGMIQAMAEGEGEVQRRSYPELAGRRQREPRLGVHGVAGPRRRTHGAQQMRRRRC